MVTSKVVNYKTNLILYGKLNITNSIINKNQSMGAVTFETTFPWTKPLELHRGREETESQALKDD